MLLVFFSLILFWMPFTSFSSLIAIVRTCRTLLSNSGKSGHPCLVPDLRKNAFSFTPLRIMFAVGLSYMALLCWGWFLFAHFWSFYHKWVLNFVKIFFCTYWDYHMIFIFQLVMCISHWLICVYGGILASLR